MTDQNNNIERIYHAWNNALANKDMDALLALYADDVVLESPLIPHLLQQESGVVSGLQQLRHLLNILFLSQPAKRQFYRKDYFTDGHTLMWEYPRLSPSGEQMDFAEVMEIADGKIQKHRVYWGWCGVNVIKSGIHHLNLEK
jgi:ketosteroid isomerase-like protein